MTVLYSKYHESLLKKWSEMSKTYSIMHSLCAEYYSDINKKLGIPVIVLGGITASSIFSSTNVHEEYLDWWVYVNGGLALIVTALAGVQNFLGTQEKTLQHQNAAFKYTKIALDIDTLLSFKRDERQVSPQEFISISKTAILEIRENVPAVLPWVMADYLNKFDKTIISTRSKVNKNEGKQSTPKSPITNNNFTLSSVHDMHSRMDKIVHPDSPNSDSEKEVKCVIEKSCIEIANKIEEIALENPDNAEIISALREINATETAKMIDNVDKCYKKSASLRASENLLTSTPLVLERQQSNGQILADLEDNEDVYKSAASRLKAMDTASDVSDDEELSFKHR